MVNLNNYLKETHQSLVDSKMSTLTSSVAAQGFFCTAEKH